MTATTGTTLDAPYNAIVTAAMRTPATAIGTRIPARLRLALASGQAVGMGLGPEVVLAVLCGAEAEVGHRSAPHVLCDRWCDRFDDQDDEAEEAGCHQATPQNLLRPSSFHEPRG